MSMVTNSKTDILPEAYRMIADKDGKDAVEILVSEAEKAKAKLIVVLKEARNFILKGLSRAVSPLIKRRNCPY